MRMFFQNNNKFSKFTRWFAIEFVYLYSLKIVQNTIRVNTILLETLSSF